LELVLPLTSMLTNGGDHIFSTLSDNSLMRPLQDFASQCVDSWVNTVLKDKYQMALDAFDSMLSTLKQLPDCLQEVVQTLEDFGRRAKVQLPAYLQDIH